jgi:hypothetical protein
LGLGLGFALHLEVKFLGHHSEDFLYVIASLGTGLKHFMKLILFGKLQSSLEGNFSLLLHLALVSDQVHAHIFTCMLLDLFQPIEQVYEGLFSGDIVGQKHTVSTSVEDTCHRLERLLPGSIPNLKLERLSIYLEPERSEFHSDCDLMLGFELIIHDSLHEATLSHTCVSNDNQLEQVILSREGLICDDLMRQSLEGLIV